MRDREQATRLISASELLTKLFSEILTDVDEFDPEIVEITKTHLGAVFPQAKAGSNLATDLIELAKNRASGGE